MDLVFVLNETHTRGISALGYNAARRELMIGYEGTVLTTVCSCLLWKLKMWISNEADLFIVNML